MSQPLVMCKAILHFDQCFNAACIKRTGNQMSQATERMRDLREINIFFQRVKTMLWNSIPMSSLVSSRKRLRATDMIMPPDVGVGFGLVATLNHRHLTTELTARFQTQTTVANQLVYTTGLGKSRLSVLHDVFGVLT